MEEIKRVITVDTKNSDKSIRDLKNEIKGLQKELEQTAVGSDEFNSALKRLTQTQRSYNEIQQQVRSMSKTNEQNMVKMAGFARNLGKAYSALNAAIGLFADGNEDVQKTMLKVQRSIQLIQGLDGIVGIIRDLPNVARGFRDWLSSLSPIERSVDRIARGINGIDPNKLNGPNGTGGGGAAAAAAAAGGGGVRDIDIETQALQEQSRVVTALNKEKDDAVKKEKALRSEMKETQKAAEANIFGGKSTIDILDKVADRAAVVEKQLDEVVRGYGSLDEAMKDPKAKALADDLAYMNEQLKNGKKSADDAIEAAKNLTDKYKDLSVEADDAAKAVKEFDDAAKSGTSSVASFFKSVGSTVFWTILISLLVTAAYKLWDYITNLRTAAREQRELNRAISEGTNQIAAKQIVILKELAFRYQKVGDSAKEKTNFLKEFSDKIKETGIAITDVNYADDIFINNTDKYVEALKNRARAQAAENVAIKTYEEYLNERYAIEEKLATAVAKRAQGAKPDYTLPMGQGMNVGYENSLLEKSVQDLLNQLDDLDKKAEDKLNNLYKKILLNEKYSEILRKEEKKNNGGGGGASAEAEVDDTFKKDLEALIQYYKEAEQVLSDEMVNAKQAIMDKYAERIALAEKYGRDTVELELAREKELADLEKQFAENQANEDYQRIQTKIERTRRMYDTSNLREPTEQRYQTTYQQPPITRALGLMGLATGTDWINVYQSKEDVEKQFEEQIKYNNKFYELTKQRIDKENELLNEQLKTEQDWLKQRLEIEGLTEIERNEIKEESADRQLEIQRTLTENMIALSDAQLQNEQANLQAYLDAQEKRREALNGILDVTSTLTGALASMARIEAENAEEGSKKQKAATVAYKAFAITQAIVDTYKGANEAYTAMASIPYVGPVLGAIAAGAAIASGIANVMAIKREDISGSTNVSSQASVTAPSGLNTPPIEYTRNLIGDKELDEMNAPIRCYVLEQDVTDKQNKVKVTEQNASF